MMACPDLRFYECMWLGQLSVAEMERLSGHLEECPKCVAAVQTLQSRDTLLEALRSHVAPAGQPEMAAAEAVIARLKMLPGAAAGTAEESPSSRAEAGPSGQAAERCAEADESAAHESALETLAPPDSAFPCEQNLYGFLAPPQGPGELGRLGPYRILKVLGAGGMGIVFQAEDVQLQRQVALKVMKAEAAQKPSARERFLREARAAAALEHENIVTIYQVGEERGVPFLAMQWLKGMSLAERLKRPGPLTAPQVLRLGRHIASGLQAAHAQGLIHRDIKPANLWLEEKYPSRAREEADSPLTDVRGSEIRIKILDFGLAREVESGAHLTQTGAIVGTPAYMAPEQGRGLPVDHRADLFSLGCVLYQMLTGQRPFAGADTMAILSSLALDTPAEPHALNPQCPPALSRLVMRLLEKQPDARPASAQAVVEALAAIEREPEPVCVAGAESSKPRQTRDGLGASTGASKTQPRPRGWKRFLVAAAVLLLVLGPLSYFFGGQIIRVVTNQGELVVVVDDETVEIKIVRNGVEVQDKTSKRAFTLTAGKGEIEVLEKNGIKLATKKFELTRGGKTTVSVTLQELADARKPKDPDRRAAEWVLSIGGTIRIKENGKEREIRAVSNLPRGAIELMTVHLHVKPKVTDAGLAHFKDCKNLTGLLLHGTQVSDAGLAHFKNCKNLMSLNLSQSQVSDVGLAHFKDCKNLTYLLLHGTQVSDAGLAHFKDCKNLTHLVLQSTAGVSDAGLAHFAASPKLGSVNVKNTKVTEAGVKKLSAALPGCKIEWDGGVIEPQTSDLPSPLDRLDRANIPLAERFSWQPKELVAVFGEHRWREWGTVDWVAFSSDGKTVASFGGNYAVRLWDVGTGKERESILLPGPGYAAFAPDGKTVAWAAGLELRFCAVAGKVRAAVKGEGTRGIGFLEFVSNGRSLASVTSGGTVTIWDAATGKEQSKVKLAAAAPIYFFRFAPDGQTFATIMKDEVRFLDTATGKERSTIKVGLWSGSGRFAPDGRTFAGVDGQNGTLTIWDVATGQKQAEIRLPYVGPVAFSPDGKTLAAGGYRPLVQLFDVATWKERAALKTKRDARFLAFSPDGQTLAECGVGPITLWDVATGKQLTPLQGHTAPLSLVALTPDGGTVISGSDYDGTGKLWDVTTGKERTTSKESGFRGVAYAPNAKLLATRGPGPSVKLWDVAIGKERGTFPFYHAVLALAISPDGNILAATTGEAHRELELWDTGKGIKSHTLRGHTGVIRSLTFAPDGKTLASGSEDKKIILWEVATGKPRTTLGGHTYEILSLAFAPDGKSLASGSQYEIKLWDLVNGQQPFTFSYLGQVLALAFTPDGKSVFSARGDGQIIQWGLEGLAVKKKEWFKLSGPVHALALSPDGRYLLTANGNGTVYILRLARPPNE